MEMLSKHTFDSFVVGKSNKFAFNAAITAVEKTGFYNPLLIYGDSGLGKTHLLYAIKNAVSEKHGAESVFLLTGERMTELLISANREEKYSDFEKELVSCKYLLVDDIHTLVGKLNTQKAFVSVFRSVVERGHQVVVTSSVEPSELPVIEASFQNDFNHAQFADIQPLDYESGKEIVSDILSWNGIQLSEAEIEHLVLYSNGNVRSVEGSIKKILLQGTS